MSDFTALCQELEKAAKLEKPFVAYRKPGASEVRLFIQKDAGLYRFTSEKESGFIFAPFSKDEAAVFFPREKCELFTSFFERTDQNKASSEKKVDLKDRVNSEHRQQYLDLVDRCLAFMKNSGTKKIVLSRKEEVRVEGLLISEILGNLLEKYPAAFVYIWYHPAVGMWAGATPETLFSLENGKFKTMALAGTQRVQGEKELVWGLKEREEQQIVTDYIKTELQGLISRTATPKTVRAGQVAHICTELEGTLTKDFGLLQLVDKLHPTPAVCGMPKETARSFIIEHEGYDRKFYTGFLGEINLSLDRGTSAKTHLFVNLRCMELFENKAVLFIGGGITGDSDKEKEWEETVAKSATMRSILI